MKKPVHPALSTRKLSELTPDARNANKGTARGSAMIRDSLRNYGAGRSILLDKHGAIIAGNKTAENAGALGQQEVIIVETDGSQLVAVQRTDLDLKDPRARQLAIADNRTSEVSLGWDTEALKSLAGDGIDLAPFWSADELEKLWPQNADLLTDEDEVPSVPAEPTSKLGDLWILGEHRLLCGDSTKRDDVDRVVGGIRPQMVFTSPPYGVGIDYGGYEDSIENLRFMLPTIAVIWLRIIQPGGFAVINFGDIAAGSEAAGARGPCEYPMALEYWPTFRRAGWVLWSRRIWCKPNPRVHSPQCIGSNRAATDWEHIWTWKAPGKPLLARVDGISPNGWFDTTKGHGVDVAKPVHGAGMAVAPAIRMLECHSKRGWYVFEPFAGTGTTLIACEKTGRTCFMVELSPAYCDVIIERWQNATGKKAVLEGA
jgi:DNA modification methylase